MKKSIIPLGIGILSIFIISLIGCTDETGGSAPQNLTLSGADYGQTVLLTWDEPLEGRPGNYMIYFREINTSDWVAGATINADTLEFIHNPSGVTGDYYVAASFGGTEYASDTMTTIPTHTDVLTVSELNAIGEQGYGWAITGDFTGATFSMTDAANDSLVDFYITNFMADSVGGPWATPWNIASPDTAPNEAGGGAVPQANWRQTWFSDPLLDPQAMLPNFASTTYFESMSSIDIDTVYIGVYLDAEGRYGLVKFFGADTTNGTIQVESWFQTVPDLRLLMH